MTLSASIREQAGHVLFAYRHGEPYPTTAWKAVAESTREEHCKMADAVAPLLRAGLFTKQDTEAIAGVAVAAYQQENARLAARVRELEGAVRAWQEAKREWNAAFDASPKVAWPARNEMMVRLNASEGALAALQIPEATK